DVASGKTVKPAISVSRHTVLAKEQEFNVRDHISDFDVSPDGKKMAFVSRGELFVSDADGKFIRQMPGSGERVMVVKWLSDSKTLLFSQTFLCYLTWYSMPSDGSGHARPLTPEIGST